MARYIISLALLLCNLVSATTFAQKYTTDARMRVSPTVSVSPKYRADTALKPSTLNSSPSYQAISRVGSARYSAPSIPYEAPKVEVYESSGGGRRYDASNWMLSRKYYELAGKSPSLASAPKGGGLDFSASQIAASILSLDSDVKKTEPKDVLVDVEMEAQERNILQEPNTVVVKTVDRQSGEVTQTKVGITQPVVQKASKQSSVNVSQSQQISKPQPKKEGVIENEKYSKQEVLVEQGQGLCGIGGVPLSQYQFTAIDPVMFANTIEEVSNRIYQKEKWLILLLCALFLFNLFVLFMLHNMIKRIYFVQQNNREGFSFNWVRSARRIAHVFILSVIGGFCFSQHSYAAVETTPDFLIYEGTLMNSGGQPIQGHMNFRFSFWRNVDFIEPDREVSIVGDVSEEGAIDVSSTDYLGWNEQHAIMTDAGGRFSMEIGSVTTLNAEIFNNPRIYLQVEVKPVVQPASKFELLDVDYGSDIIDRMVFDSVPYAFNADRLDFHETGYETTEIPYLDEDALLPTSTIPGGTDQDTFTIDADGSAGDDDILSLIFGSSLGKMFSWDGLLDRFTLSDTLEVVGDLKVTGSIMGEDAVNIEGDLVVSGAIEGGDDDEILMDDDVVITGNLYIIGELNGIDFRNRFQTELLSPIYPGAIFDGPGTGNMYDELDNYGGISRNAIRWETWIPTQQAYYISVRWVIPNDFIAFQDDPISFEYRTEGTPAQAMIDIEIEKGDELGIDQLGGTGLGLSSTDWATAEFNFIPGTDWDGGDTLLFTITTYSIDDFFSRVGDIRINFIRE